MSEDFSKTIVKENMILMYNCLNKLYIVNIFKTHKNEKKLYKKYKHVV